VSAGVLDEQTKTQGALMHELLPPPPTIFLVEEDNDTRSTLTRSLRELGYRLLVSADLEDAFEWTSGNGYIHADLVLVDLSGKLPEEALTIGRRLREHCKYDGHTPLIIMPEKIPQHLQGTDKKVNDLDWICYYEDVDQLKRLLAHLLSKNGKPAKS
jgi:CheY-like chemotaxis protein